jgi:probable selenium-dependent hydroxylase accessory protein YqeC
MDSNQKIIYSIIEKLVKGTRRKKEGPGVLSESFGLKPREVISLTGAGGKTTLMFCLAKELFLAGKRVVTTTTTKILEPTSGETGSLFINLDEEKLKLFVQEHLDEYRHVTLARERFGSAKLKGVSSDLVNDLWSLNKIDYIIVEADGAAGLPIKAPREGEPVIPPSTTLVVAILGVDGVERELNEGNIFQAERVSKLTGIPMGRKITDEALAILMTHPEGIFKGAPSSSRVIAFLNKVDIPDGVIKAKDIAQKIIERKHRQIERIVLGQLRNEPPVVEVVFP